MTKKPNRLITVTRSDLSSGYQTVQSAHAIADFAFKKPFSFIKWWLFGKYMICLSVKNLTELVDFTKLLKEHKVGYISFYEPDIDEITAIAITPSEKGNRLSKRLKLANSKTGKIDKNTK